MMTTKTARDRLTEALPHIFAAFQDAKANGLPTLAIAARNEDESGKIYLTMNDPEDFLRDIAEVVGCSYELTEKQQMEYKAAQFLSRFN